MDRGDVGRVTTADVVLCADTGGCGRQKSRKIFEGEDEIENASAADDMEDWGLQKVPGEKDAHWQGVTADSDDVCALADGLEEEEWFDGCVCGRDRT